MAATRVIFSVGSTAGLAVGREVSLVGCVGCGGCQALGLAIFTSARCTIRARVGSGAPHRNQRDALWMAPGGMWMAAVAVDSVKSYDGAAECRSDSRQCLRVNDRPSGGSGVES